MNDNIWLHLSSIPFLLTGILLIDTHLIVEGLTFINIFLWSLLYHICWNSYSCILNKNLLQFMDIYSAYIVALYQIVFYIDIRPRKYKSICHFIVSIVIIAIIYNDLFNNYIKYAIIALYICVIGLYYTIYICKYLIDTYWKNYSQNVLYKLIFANRKNEFFFLDLIFVFWGLICFGSAIICGFYMNDNLYWILHSLWHIFLDLGCSLLYLCHRRKSYITTFFKYIFEKIKLCLHNRQNTVIESYGPII